MATGQVLEYEAGLDKWELGPGVPESLQGACGVSAGDRVILTGGKNDKECSYGSQSVWVLDGGEWMRGPDMSHARSLMIKTCFTHGQPYSCDKDQRRYLPTSGFTTAAP